jgi:formylglycine-generating enzyme required for sulfatase activity
MEAALRARGSGFAWLLALTCAGCGADQPSENATLARPSCPQLGARACQGESCCVSLAVPTQSFTLGGSVESPSAAATVSGYSLDKYEVTVGRFRAFISAYDAWRSAGNPVAGAGVHPLIADSGWSRDWSLEETAAQIDSQAGVQCSSLSQTFTVGSAELPINCVTWLEAFAFCIWDGGRLPTEAEWEAAASGGDEGWPFPWGTSEPDASRAAYDCTGDGSAAQDCAITDILDVGSKSAGAGRWGHQDLAGNVWEWVRDSYQAYPAIARDYANVTDVAYRTIRGSGWASEANDLRSPIRYNSLPTARRSEFGFRCAGAVR